MSGSELQFKLFVRKREREREREREGERERGREGVNMAQAVITERKKNKISISDNSLASVDSLKDI